MRIKNPELAWVLGVFVVSVCVRLVRLDHTPQWDEMYHFLAGQSWLHNGTFAIADGEYLRARLFTVLVGISMGIFGETLVAARLPSVLAGALGVAFLYRFTAAQAGRIAGLIAAGILCFHPLSIYLGQLSRFYALHGLCFWVGAYAVFQVVEDTRHSRQRSLWMITALLCLALAAHLQVTTLIGVGALCIWVGLRLSWRWGLSASAGETRAAWLLAALWLVAILGALAAWQTGLLEHAIKSSQMTLGWGEESKNEWRYYIRWMTNEIPALWYFLPFAILVALRHQPAFAFFSTVVFGGILVVHSLAALKGSRFVFYGLPFLAAIWGIALAVAFPKMVQVMHEILNRASARPMPAPLVRGAAIAGVGAIAAFLLVTNPALRLSYRMVSKPDSQWSISPQYRGYPDWNTAAATLKPLVAQHSVLVTSCGVKALYYLGKYDFQVNVTEVPFSKTGAEFGVDPRTGRLVVGQPASVATLISNHLSGLIVIEQSSWRKKFNVPDNVADYIESHAEAVPLKPEWRLLAFRWQHQPEKESSLLTQESSSGSSR